VGILRYGTRVRALTLAIAFLSSIKLAEAANAADVLNEFGLLGTWSADCAPGPTETDDRTIYKSFSLGNPRVAHVTHDPAHKPGGHEGVSNAEEEEIRAAVEIDADKIAIVLAPMMRATKENGVWVSLPLGPIVEQTIQKIGDKIQLIDWHAIDGRGIYVKGGFQYSFGGRNIWKKTEYQTPQIGKCL
jgi:hypothetical protein